MAPAKFTSLQVIYSITTSDNCGVTSSLPSCAFKPNHPSDHIHVILMYDFHCSVSAPAAECSEKAADSPETIAIQAVNMLSQGKRNMLVGEIPQACNQLQEACRLL